MQPVGWGGIEVRSPLLLPDLRLFVQGRWRAGWGGFGRQLVYRGNLIESYIRRQCEHPRDVEIYLCMGRKAKKCLLAPLLDTEHAPGADSTARNCSCLGCSSSILLLFVVLFLCSLHLLLWSPKVERQSEGLPPGKIMSAFWMRASTTPTT